MQYYNIKILYLHPINLHIVELIIKILILFLIYNYF